MKKVNPKVQLLLTFLVQYQDTFFLCVKIWLTSDLTSLTRGQHVCGFGGCLYNCTAAISVWGGGVRKQNACCDKTSYI